jgi:hypothetical protein
MLVRKVTALAAIVVLGLSLAPAAQALPPLTWEKTAGRELNDVATDPEGNVYVTGFRWDRGRDRTVMIVRSFASDGSVRWKRSWVPPDIDGLPTSTVGREIDVAGGVVVVGGQVARWICNAEGWWLRTYTTDGELLWQRQQRGWRRCAIASWTEAVTTDGRSILLGWNELKGEPYVRGHLRTYDLDGTVRWNSAFEVPRFGDVMDGVRDATITGPGRVYVAGWTRDRPDRDPTGRYHLVVQKFSPSGSLLWTRRPGPPSRALASADTIDARGGSLLVGATIGRLSGHIAWLGSLTVIGRVDWIREWPARGWETSVALASKGSSYVIHGVRSGGDGGADARIRHVGPGGDVLSTGRLDRGPVDVEMTSIAAMKHGFVVAASVEPPVGGYVARFG